MSINATYAFILNDKVNWKISNPDHWRWDIVELIGNEKLLGHHKLDGSIYKIVESNGMVVALPR